MSKRARDNMGVMHEFASGEFSDGQNSSGSVFFIDRTIFSYGSHFPMAYRVENKSGERAFLMTTDSYSPTTAKQMSYLWRALHGNGEIFNVENVQADMLIRKSKEISAARAGKFGAHLENFADYRERFARSLETVTRSRKYKDSSLESALRLAKEANSYAEFFGLDERIDTENFDLDSIAEAVKRAEADRKEAEKKKRARLEKENKKTVKKWRAGESVYIPHELGPFLRISADGQTVETSQRASFPAKMAALAWSMIERTRARGERWSANGESLKLGYHRIDYIEANGDVKAGCHFVKFAESVAIARALGISRTYEIAKQAGVLGFCAFSGMLWDADYPPTKTRAQMKKALNADGIEVTEIERHAGVK